MSDPRPALRARADAARDALDGLAEAAARTDLATAELAYGALTPCAEALGRAADLYDLAARPTEASRTRFALSQVVWKARPGSTLALKHLEEAERAARRAGDLALLARILDGKADMAVAAQAWPEAARLLNDVVALRESIGDGDGRLVALRRMATVASLAGDRKRAAELLADGIVGPPGAVASPGQALRARLELVQLQRAATPASGFAGSGAEPLSLLLADAVAAGERAAAGYIRVQMAADANLLGRHEEAQAYAESARQDALEVTDPTLYLLACLSIAESREKLGDHAGTLGILFTARATLADLAGEAAGRPVLEVVESLEKRWGQAVFDQALAEHRRRVG